MEKRVSRCSATFWGVALVGVLVDQLTKWWAVTSLGEQPVRLVGDFLFLRLIRNPGAAFSLGSGRAWLFAVMAVVVSGAIVWYARRVTSFAWAWTLGLLLAGAVGNLIDRLFRAPGFGAGHVVDFIGYGNWFIGNVADIYLVVAAIVLAVLAAMGVPLSGADSAAGDVGD